MVSSLKSLFEYIANFSFKNWHLAKQLNDFVQAGEEPTEPGKNKGTQTLPILIFLAIIHSNAKSELSNNIKIMNAVCILNYRDEIINRLLLCVADKTWK